MKRTFQVGDRVRIYGFDPEDAGETFVRVVADVDVSTGLLETDEGEFVHPKQCRRLVKKPRRRVWFVVTGGRLSAPKLILSNQKDAESIVLGGYEELIEFTEVHRKGGA